MTTTVEELPPKGGRLTQRGLDDVIDLLVVRRDVLGVADLLEAQPKLCIRRMFSLTDSERCTLDEMTPNDVMDLVRPATSLLRDEKHRLEARLRLYKTKWKCKIDRD
jgi:hypothetical protein